MESWMAEALGFDYADSVLAKKIGFPSAHSEADFEMPCRMGDLLDIELRVAEVGETSMRLEYVVRAADDPKKDVRARGATVVVVVDLDPRSETHGRALPIPQDLRARVQRFRGP
jgi:4-hydroxybenzoyl-CoA thioesterase